MLKGQEVQDTVQVLPQPGLKAEEVDVEVSRLNTGGRLPAGVCVGETVTRVVKTPAHQAHLEGRDNKGGDSGSPLSKPQPLWFAHRPPTWPSKDLYPGRPHFSPEKTCISAQGKLLPQTLLQGEGMWHSVVQGRTLVS